MKRFWIVIVLSLLAVTVAFAQEETTVAVMFEAETLETGGVVDANIYVIQGNSIAGADVQIEVDPACLQIEEMRPGNFLPAEAENGGFSLVNEYTQTSARLAATITDRQRVATGDGLYMRVPMRILCDTPAEAVTVARAELVNDMGQQFTVASIVDDVRTGTPLIEIEAISPQGPNMMVIGLGALLASGVAALLLAIVLLIYRAQQQRVVRRA